MLILHTPYLLFLHFEISCFGCFSNVEEVRVCFKFLIVRTFFVRGHILRAFSHHGKILITIFPKFETGLVKENENFTVIAAKVYKGCNDFKLAELSADNFKCLVFLSGINFTKGCRGQKKSF